MSGFIKKRDGDEMKRFCRECGKEVNPNHNNCIHCGTVLQVRQVNQTEQSSSPDSGPKPRIESSTRTKNKQVPKKRKYLIGIILSFITVIIGFSVWAYIYHSSESVQKRFDAAILHHDHSKIQKMMIHEDGSDIHEQEAEAFLELINDEGEEVVIPLTTIVNNGKFLGIFDTYKVEAVDQFVFYDELVDGLTFEFNQEEFPELEREDDRVVYGPLVPGTYTATAVYEGEYGETTMEDIVTLQSDKGEHTWMGMEVPVSKVDFYVKNYDRFDVSQAYIQLNDEKIPITDEGKADEIGPFILDGSQKVQVVVEMPWGEVTSESFAIDDSDLSIYANLISEEQSDEMLTVLTEFGENYVKALSERDIKPLKGISKEAKKGVSATIDDMKNATVSTDYYYTGQLETVEINENSIYIHENSEVPIIKIDTRYIFKEDFYEYTDQPDLYEQDYTWEIGLSFDKEDNEWLITSLDSLNMWASFEATNTREGSKKLYGPSKEVLAKAEKQEETSGMEEFIKAYTDASIEAINKRDFSLVSSYITEEGPRRKEAREYIDYLDSKDIYEEWYGSEVEKIEEVDKNTWTVTVIEEFDIQKPDSSAVKKFRTVLTVKRVDGEYYIDELIETNEL